MTTVTDERIKVSSDIAASGSHHASPNGAASPPNDSSRPSENRMALIPLSPSPHRSQLAVVRAGSGSGHWDDPNGQYMNESVIDEVANDPAPLQGKPAARRTSVARSRGSASPADASPSTQGRRSCQSGGIHIEWADTKPVSWMGHQSEYVQEACAKGPRNQRMERARIAAEAAHTVDDVICLLRGKPSQSQKAKELQPEFDSADDVNEEDELAYDVSSKKVRNSADDVNEEDELAYDVSSNDGSVRFEEDQTVSGTGPKEEDVPESLDDPAVLVAAMRRFISACPLVPLEGSLNAQLREQLVALRPDGGGDDVMGQQGEEKPGEEKGQQQAGATTRETLQREGDAFAEAMTMLTLCLDEESAMWLALANGDDPDGTVSALIVDGGAIVDARKPNTAAQMYETFKTRVESLPLDERDKAEAVHAAQRELRDANVQWAVCTQDELRRLDSTSFLMENPITAEKRAERQTVVAHRLALAAEETKLLPPVPEVEAPRFEFDPKTEAPEVISPDDETGVDPEDEPKSATLPPPPPKQSPPSWFSCR